MTKRIKRRISLLKKRRAYAWAAMALAFFVVLALGPGQSLQAQTFTTLYNFCPSGGLPCPTGAFPQTSVVQDDSGNIYGTTHDGGVYGSQGYGYGVVFEVRPTGDETVLYEFMGSSDGAGPNDLLRDSAGNLYGTTANAGEWAPGCPYGCGVVFELDPTTGEETVLYRFAGGTTDGCVPTGGLIQDKSGNFYGITSFCGKSNQGTIFKLTESGEETVLHSFAGGAKDGASPGFATPVMDKKGNLYGATFNGGPSDNGVVYKLSQTGRLTLLHSFAGGQKDGCNSYGTLARDTDGTLYGTTVECGSFSAGTVWKVTKEGSETLLHNFSGSRSDGYNPTAGVVRDLHGSLFGDAGGGSNYYGTVYKLSANGIFTLLHSFLGTDGADPSGGVFRDADGILYGTSFDGGSGCCGTVWKITP